MLLIWARFSVTKVIKCGCEVGTEVNESVILNLV